MGVRDVAVDAYEEALPALLASMVGGLASGVVLSGMRAELQAVPGLLVLVPALLATRGNVYGSFGARLATGLHQGLVEPVFDIEDDRLRAATAAAMGNGLLASVYAAVGGFVILQLLARTVAPLPVLVGIAFLAGFLSGIALTAAVLVVVIVGFRRGYNPDTLVGPLVTTTGDVFGVAFLLLSVRVVLGVL
ncbi:magnesium transporter [Halocalculus aciditolerans]|uniref:Membrane protein n=1 Tax=Halocalculus aciditolerans TaxID=1383812 RepID=A0A830FEP3_9EURY|nr:magnesium transporter [Halocalculus aciditolerans]GGL46075.1 membrane protein [Halocalculus aciditolerans]